MLAAFEVPAQRLTMAERHLPLLWVYILGTAIQLTLGKGRISEKPRLLSWGRAWVASTPVLGHVHSLTRPLHWELLCSCIGIAWRPQQRDSGQHGGNCLGMAKAMDVAKELRNPGPRLLGRATT